MSDVAAAVTTLLDEKPTVESELRKVIAVDADREAWTFDDVPVDSGVFGELVSRNIVIKENGGYRVNDPEAVRKALDTDTGSTETFDEGGQSALSSIRPTVSLRWGGALVAVIAVAALFRGYPVSSVFRDSHVVFLGNDPYFYRHWIRQQMLAPAGPLSVPNGIRNGEPLLIAAVWTFTTVLGGDASTGYTLLALYPLVCGLVTIPLVYGITRRATGDRRIALAAALLLAVTPVHIFRTALGFADHHAFDYLWLAVTLLAGVALMRNPRAAQLDISPATVVWVGVFAIGMAAQTLAWNAGPLLLLPLAVFSLGVVVAARAHDISPVPTLAPVVIGVGLASVIVWAAHLTLGWQPRQVVLTPTLLVIGIVALAAVGAIATRYDLSPLVTGGGVVGGGGAVLAVTLVALPEFTAEFTNQFARLFGFSVPEGIVETASIFSPQYGTLFGPVLFFGLSLFFALPYVIWSLYIGYREYSPRLLLLGTYAAVFTVLAVLQVRFAGELSIALAPFAGLALVHMASIVDAVPRPTVLDAPTSSETRSGGSSAAALRLPNGQTIGALVVVFLLIGGFGLVQGPIQTNKLVYSDDAYRTATWLEGHAMQSEQAPESTYVLSAWGENRMYNAFVSGDSRSYGFAQETYTEFISSPQPDSWYERLSSRTDYIVLTAVANQNDAGYEQTTHAMLYNSYGSATAAHDGVGRYQAVYQSPRGSHIVVRPVTGAVIEGTAEAESTVSVATEVSVPNAEFTYTRRAQVAANGTYRVRVPYAGTYTVGDTQVSVSADAVESGTVVQAR